jgi:ribonuclease HI
MKASLYTDGGARGNPGPAAIGYVLTMAGRDAIEHGEFIGRATNNQAEYTALRRGIERARREGVDELNCFLDSELVVKQMAGDYRVRDADLKPLYADVCGLLDSFARVTFNHVRREKNKRADKLVNHALDQKQNTPLD